MGWLSLLTLSWHWHLRHSLCCAWDRTVAWGALRVMVLIATLALVTVLAARGSLSTRCLCSCILASLPIQELLALAILREMRKKLEQRQQELSLLCAQVLTQLLKLLHVLLRLLSLPVSSKLDLIDTLEHVSLALLSRLELTNIEGLATEWLP